MGDQSNIGQESLTDQYVHEQYFGNIHTKNVPVSGDNSPFVYDSYGNKSTLQLHKDHIVIDDDIITERSIIDSLFPIGFIKLTTSSTAPEIPFTTWESVAEGQLLVGAGSGNDSTGRGASFNVGSNSNGEYSHRLTINEMPEHNHDISVGDSSFDYFVMWNRGGYMTRQEATKDGGGNYGFEHNGFVGAELQEVGGFERHANTPPSTAYYIWKRVN